MRIDRLVRIHSDSKSRIDSDWEGLIFNRIATNEIENSFRIGAETDFGINMIDLEWILIRNFYQGSLYTCSYRCRDFARNNVLSMIMSASAFNSCMIEFSIPDFNEKQLSKILLRY